MDRRDFLKAAAAVPIMLPYINSTYPMPEALWMDYDSELWLGGKLVARRDFYSQSWHVFSGYGVLYVPDYLLVDRGQNILEFVRTGL